MSQAQFLWRSAVALAVASTCGCYTPRVRHRSTKVASPVTSAWVTPYPAAPTVAYPAPRPTVPAASPGLPGDPQSAAYPPLHPEAPPTAFFSPQPALVPESRVASGSAYAPLPIDAEVPSPRPADRTRDPRSARQRSASLTVSALHPVVFATYDAALEFRLGRQAGLAFAFGLGTLNLRRLDRKLPDDDAKIWQAGGQLRFYLVGNFDHGLQVGFEALYISGSATSQADVSLSATAKYSGTITATGKGFKLGPFVG
ncbi:MAG TPA: hypothetical protein VJT73_01420, partial [Polyangiaceae bacterium]|nr:hypothetical protein [Polyangiaceae bacterium]